MSIQRTATAAVGAVLTTSAFLVASPSYAARPPVAPSTTPTQVQQADGAGLAAPSRAQIERMERALREPLPPQPQPTSPSGPSGSSPDSLVVLTALAAAGLAAGGVAVRRFRHHGRTAAPATVTV